MEMCLRFKKPFFFFLNWGFPIDGQGERAPWQQSARGGGRVLGIPLDISASLSPQCSAVGFPVLPGFGERHLHPQLLQDPPHPPGPAPTPAPRLQVQPPRAGLLCPPAPCSVSCQVNSHFAPPAASSVLGRGTPPSPPATPWGSVHQLGLWRMGALGPPKTTRGLGLVALGAGVGTCWRRWVWWPQGWHRPGVALPCCRIARARAVAQRCRECGSAQHAVPVGAQP